MGQLLEMNENDNICKFLKNTEEGKILVLIGYFTFL